MPFSVDTSAHTTSVAVVGETGEVLADERILLKVGPGKGVSVSLKPISNIPAIFRY